MGCSLSQAQTVSVLSLEEVIALAQEQSLDAISARHQFRARYWEYKAHKAEFLPSMSVSASPVNLNRSIITVVNPDGSESFAHRNQLNSSGNITIQQNIGATGGNVFIRSDLQRITFLGDSIMSTYLSSPVSIGFTQPLLGFNRFKWDRKIQPLKYDEAKKTYAEAMENVSIKAVNLFFDLALAQINLRIAKINKSNSDTLFQISKGRYNIGKIARNELLEMELSSLNSGTAYNEALLNLEMRKFALRSFLGFTEKVDIELALPEDIPEFEIDVTAALELARMNNSQIVAMERQLLEAEKEVARARAENRFNASLYATYGLTQSASDLSNTYRNPEDQQTALVGVSIPLIDWGLGKGRYEMAKSSEEIVKTSIQQQIIDFEQNVFLKVMQFNLQDDQCAIAKKADTIAIQRSDVAMQRFYIGKIDVLNLNIAQREKDDAKRSYFSTLRSYWSYYYTIRKLTLYDFESNKPIEYDIESLIP